MDVKEFYRNLNLDPTGVLHRFGGNEIMLEKFLNKFLADSTFQQLSFAIEKNDLEEIFHSAHTLKGLCGNFDFKELYEYSSKIVECYRSQQYELIPLWFEKLKKSYQFIIDTLKLFL